jgi:hypothetical protein
MTKDEALKQALEALNDLAAWNDGEVGGHMDEPYAAEAARRTITSIKEALAQPEQKPVGLIESLKDAQPCCGEYQTCWRACTPRGKFLAQRTWVGLTDEEVMEIAFNFDVPSLVVRTVEAKLKEKNT